MKKDGIDNNVWIPGSSDEFFLLHIETKNFDLSGIKIGKHDSESSKRCFLWLIAATNDGTSL